MHHIIPGTFLQGGKYRIDRVIGQGGFGITYLAFSDRLRKYVAIKEYFPRQYCDRDAASPQIIARSHTSALEMERYCAKFIKEAVTISKLFHPNIVSIIDVFKENGSAYFAMDYVEGPTLNQMAEHSLLPTHQAVRYISRIAEALRHIHSNRINHLDIKPANIIIRMADDEPILIDFGLAKNYNKAGIQTSATPIGVSRGYAPLEQYTGAVENFSPESDIYSLTATLFKALTGQTPPEPSAILNAGGLFFPQNISPQMQAFIRKGMAVSKSDRFHSIDEFIIALNQVFDMRAQYAPVQPKVAPLQHPVEAPVARDNAAPVVPTPQIPVPPAAPNGVESFDQNFNNVPAPPAAPAVPPMEAPMPPIPEPPVAPAAPTATAPTHEVQPPVEQPASAPEFPPMPPAAEVASAEAGNNDFDSFEIDIDMDDDIPAPQVDAPEVAPAADLQPQAPEIPDMPTVFPDTQPPFTSMSDDAPAADDFSSMNVSIDLDSNVAMPPVEPPTDNFDTEKKKKDPKKKGSKKKETLKDTPKKPASKKRSANSPSKKKNLKGPLLLISLIVLVIVGVGAVFYFQMTDNSNADEPLLPAAPADSTAVADTPATPTDALQENLTVSKMPFVFGGLNALYTGTITADSLPDGHDCQVEFTDGPIKTYHGDIAKGKVTGQGTVTYTSGDSFTGTLDNTVFIEGTLRYTSGKYFKGTFKDDACYNGTWYNKDNRAYAKVVNGKEQQL